MKKYNFNAGPSMLPREVIEKTAQQCLDFNGSGLSLMEISHRAKDRGLFSYFPWWRCQSRVLHDSIQLPD